MEHSTYTSSFCIAPLLIPKPAPIDEMHANHALNPTTALCTAHASYPGPEHQEFQPWDHVIEPCLAALLRLSRLVLTCDNPS